MATAGDLCNRVKVLVYMESFNEQSRACVKVPDNMIGYI